MTFQRPAPLSFLLAALAFGVVALVGCDSAGTEEDETSAGGTVNVQLTDAPLDGVVEAHVTIEEVVLVGEEGRFTLSDETQEFDLLELQNGVTADLADAEVPEGEYEQLRLILGEEATLVFDDGSETNLKVPSGPQTGIKINLPDFEIDEDADAADIVIDFDAAKSFVKAGKSGKWIFKPTLKAKTIALNGENLDEDAEITGRITGTDTSGVTVEGFRFPLTDDTDVEGAESAAALEADQFVELEASRTDTALVAQQIEVREASDVATLEAPLESVDAGALTLLGTVFSVDDATELDGLTALADLETGERVAVEFAYDAEAGTYQALKVEAESSDDEEGDGAEDEEA